jgi:thiamine biosynthesis lipoprotein
MRVIRKILPTCLFLTVTSAPVPAALHSTPGVLPGKPASIERRLGAMGTVLTIHVAAPHRELAIAASEAAVLAVEAAEARLSTWRDDSELSRLNRQPVGEPLPLTRELADDLARARTCWRDTGGAFDPAVGALVDAWALRSGGRKPAPDEIESALVPGGLAALELEASVAVRRESSLVIEEGAFGKGAGLDDALVALRAAGATRALIDFGGEVAVLGEGDPFAIGVADPRDREREVLELLIDGGAVATSGNSERGIVVDGIAHGHFLDPRSGMPVPDFGTLTVWAPDALTADCLSTGLYVMGPDRALAWASQRPQIEVLVLEPLAGGRLRGRLTGGFTDRARALREELDLEFVMEENPCHSGFRPEGEPRGGSSPRWWQSPSR